jgi:hypothetical protein
MSSESLLMIKLWLLPNKPSLPLATLPRLLLMMHWQHYYGCPCNNSKASSPAFSTGLFNWQHCQAFCSCFSNDLNELRVIADDETVVASN